MSKSAEEFVGKALGIENLQPELVEKMLRDQEETSNEIKNVYNLTIKRLESLMTISGAILTVATGMLIWSGPLIAISFNAIAVAVASITLVVCMIGHFIPRYIISSIDSRDNFLRNSDTMVLSNLIRIHRQRMITDHHNKANEDVWKYIRRGMILLMISIAFMIASVIAHEPWAR